jgi:hypothetical protein
MLKSVVAGTDMRVAGAAESVRIIAQDGQTPAVHHAGLCAYSDAAHDFRGN